MADAVPTIPCPGDAPLSHSIPCLAFGAAVQAVERLLQADTRASGLSYGDPAYGNAPASADRQLGLAIEATAQAAEQAEEDRYRAAAGTMYAMLVAVDPATLRDGLAEMRRLEMDAYILVDRTVRLSVLRAAGVMESLYRAWTVDAVVEPVDPVLEDDLQGEEAWALFEDPTTLTPG